MLTSLGRRAIKVGNFNGVQRCMSGFSFAGPRKLDEVMKTELLEGKSKTEVSDMWMAYHENQEGVLASTLDVDNSIKVLDRAKKRPFFIQPVFREDGHFMLVSQYQSPSHFFLAYLESYRMDPDRAQPLITFSVFTELQESHDISLLRCDVINRGIEVKEASVIMKNVIDSYRIDEDFLKVKDFNDTPEKFDIDDYISCMKLKLEVDDKGNK
mmetsp:Transcript_1658/g.1814  ORF Transcript_1658/g.1814 Transcript_1658/m.1814 type:complete len:212 (+) Transcript_1658:135-770(+)|eukprot:CAMPEP_0198248788 /NCGR_PEP_ID=MMETSP1447-20131203/478_1 /TAXON_ID=420782 /ORGANISM="Chaetoceros dichaeta, Strain CCMP1751" /LENGTH=211 /DNA_ID=CAMNT_0043933267 /DNA_START=121 /DNA_END=756 /DNA_ORIENTATION=+